MKTRQFVPKQPWRNIVKVPFWPRKIYQYTHTNTIQKKKNHTTYHKGSKHFSLFKNVTENNPIVSTGWTTCTFSEATQFWFLGFSLEGSFPLSCNIISMFHWYLKFSVCCHCEVFSKVSFTHYALKYQTPLMEAFLYFSLKNEAELKFLLGSHDFQGHPFLSKC